MQKKPEDIDEYKKWLKEKHNCEITERTRTYYDSVASAMKRSCEKSFFWTQITENLRRYDQEYQLDKKYPLLIPNFEPELTTKSFGSFLLKTFRKNIIDNERYPDEPNEGWILPSNWFSRINDILRTLFVVKYLDGVEFLKNRIKSVCEQNDMEFECYLEAREEGYYAAHLYTKQEFQIPKETWDTMQVKCSVELQITTQLQEVIRLLLHKYYEERRIRAKARDSKWQWDYKSDEFIANYMGHILHYVEGMIVEIREKQKEEKIWKKVSPSI